MKRFLTCGLIVLAGVWTSGCASGLYSTAPLFTPAKDQLKPGL